MAAPLQYLLNTFKVVVLEKVSFSNTQNPKTFFNTLTVDGKHYLLNRDNWAQPIQIQLSQKKIFFLNFFLAFLKSTLNLKHLPKKITVIVDVFPEIPAPKSMVR